MLTLIYKLYRIKLLTIGGLLCLCEAIWKNGVNLMALLSFAAKFYPNQTAIVADRERVRYDELWQQTERLAGALYHEYGIGSQQKVALVCRNHAIAIRALFACSRLGVHTYLLNPEMSASQLWALEEHHHFDFFIYDPQIAHYFETPALRQKSLPAYHPVAPSLAQCLANPPLAETTGMRQLVKAKSGNIIVLTGGTTGQPKSVSRKPALLPFLAPFCALLTQVQLDHYPSIYIATPICHGYGVAFLLLGVVLGLEMYVRERFDAANACTLIGQNKIQGVTLVPVMLQRMLKVDPAALSSLQYIISGSALLPPSVAQETIRRLGPKLFNLYGTSEAGFSILGTPEILHKKAESIGKPLWGVRTKIVDQSGQEVAKQQIGQLWIRSRWTNNEQSWVATGDLAYQDAEGDIFLCGRVDDMIVSGGENVYPVEVENILAQHLAIEAAVVVGIPDAEFGQRLKAVVVQKPHTSLDAPTLLEWLKPRVARYQMPAIIDFRNELPYTAPGKVDKRALRCEENQSNPLSIVRGS